MNSQSTKEDTEMTAEKIDNQIFGYTEPGTEPSYIMAFSDGPPPSPVKISMRQKVDGKMVYTDIELPPEQAKKLHRALVRAIMPTNAA